MFNQQIIDMIVQVILIIAALNWGLVAYNGMDAVQMITGGGQIEQYAKFAVAAVAVYAAYRMYAKL
jgi:uncharacterized membrane protein YuzA (DUF378 family)